MASRGDAVAGAVFGAFAGALVGGGGGVGVTEYELRKHSLDDTHQIKTIRKAAVCGTIAGAILGAIIGGSGCCAPKVT